MDTANKPDAPSTSSDFDEAYRSRWLHWVWSDLRVPKELKDVVVARKPETSLELGCGLGRFSSFMARNGIRATGVDFSPVAIGKANERVARDENKPTFIVGDVTDLHTLAGQFDLSFDVGCFHCLNEAGEKKYVEEVYRLLKPGETHLLWALDHVPSGIAIGPEYISNVFKDRFQLRSAKPSRRRSVIVASHWYSLVRT